MTLHFIGYIYGNEETIPIMKGDPKANSTNWGSACECSMCRLEVFFILNTNDPKVLEAKFEVSSTPYSLSRLQTDEHRRETPSGIW